MSETFRKCDDFIASLVVRPQPVFIFERGATPENNSDVFLLLELP